MENFTDEKICKALLNKGFSPNGGFGNEPCNKRL